MLTDGSAPVLMHVGQRYTYHMMQIRCNFAKERIREIIKSTRRAVSLRLASNLRLASKCNGNIVNRFYNSDAHQPMPNALLSYTSTII